jgi:hypothetical protein
VTGIWKFNQQSTMPPLFTVGARPGLKGVTYCDFLNGMEMRAAGFYEGRPRTKPFPIAQLAVTQELFDADYFVWEGRQVVSERLRQAMALDPSEVRYFEVDASRSAPLPRSKNYQIMEPVVLESVSDPEQSDYEAPPFREEYARIAKSLGKPTNEELNDELNIVLANRIAIRADAAPSHQLFYDRFFRLHLMCTESLALRVLSTGCTGVSFSDPSRLKFPMKRRLRTLRGIEEVVEVDANGIEVTELIQAID